MDILAEGDTVSQLRGILSLKRKGSSLCRTRLVSAARYFKDALGKSIESGSSEFPTSPESDEQDQEETTDDETEENGESADEKEIVDSLATI